MCYKKMLLQAIPSISPLSVPQLIPSKYLQMNKGFKTELSKGLFTGKQDRKADFRDYNSFICCAEVSSI